MSWEWFLINAKEIMTYLVIAAGLIFCIWVFINSFNPRSFWYNGDKVYCGWEKEDAKKAKAEEKRRKNKKWYEA